MIDTVKRALRLGRLLLCAVPLVAALPGAAAADPSPVFKHSPQTLSEADRRATAKLYAQVCSGCHGMTGGGVDNGLALYNSKVPKISASVIHFGAVEPVAKPVIMPAFGALEILSPTEIGQLAEYIKSFRPPWP